MTLPAVTGLLDCLATAPPVRAAPRVRPAPVLAAVAADPAWPRTVASAIGGEPLETTRLTAEPLATLVPAVGLSLMPLPAATVLLDCCVTAPTMRPAPVMALVAADCVWPTTFGTAICAGPLERSGVPREGLATRSRGVACHLKKKTADTGLLG